MTIVAAADGSALGNPGPAGWAWYVDENCWRAGGWPHGTNNMGELMAVLDLFKSTAHVPQEPLHILCDSQYVINSVTKWMPGWKRKGWKKSDGKPVLNLELLKEIDAALVGRKYTFEWVKGHAGHHLNEAADDRARDAATAFQAKRAPNEGPGFAGAAPAAVHASAAPAAAQAPVPASTGQERTVPDRVVAEGNVEALQLDLFSALEDDDLDPAFTAPGGQGLETIADLERSLLDPDVRADPGAVALLLHPDFEEIGASGRLWARDDLISAMIQEEPINASLEVLSLTAVDTESALLLYRSVGHRGSMLRSSLWRKDNGQWRLRFHQGTPEA